MKRLKVNLIYLILLSMVYSCSFSQNREQLAKKYSYISDYGEDQGIIMVGNKVNVNGEKESRYGYIDLDGKEIVPLKYESAGNFFEGKGGVKFQEKWGFINKEGKEVVPFKYDYSGHFANGLASVQLNGKSGFVNDIGQEVVPLKYDHVFDFDAVGVAQVGTIIGVNGNLNINKYGLINKKGEEIVPIKYDDIGIFYDDNTPAVAVITTNGKSGLIDNTGKIIIALKYDNIEVYYGLQKANLFKVRLGTKEGLVNIKGEEITKIIYDYVEDLNEGEIGVSEKGNKYFIGVSGKRINGH
ncbi:WG repeat-containing protein [Pedobacter sp. PAMC26386]|nr:WG repeat-containing protein [Pedobacter sp. PAMC26386]